MFFARSLSNDGGLTHPRQSFPFSNGDPLRQVNSLFLPVGRVCLTGGNQYQAFLRHRFRLHIG